MSDSRLNYKKRFYKLILNRGTQEPAFNAKKNFSTSLGSTRRRFCGIGLRRVGHFAAMALAPAVFGSSFAALLAVARKATPKIGTRFTAFPRHSLLRSVCTKERFLKNLVRNQRKKLA